MTLKYEKGITMKLFKFKKRRELTAKRYGDLTEEEKEILMFEEDYQREKFEYRKTHGLLTEEEKRAQREFRAMVGLAPDPDFD